MIGASVTPYGSSLVAALLTAWWLARQNAQVARISPSHIDLLVPLSFVMGLLLAMTVSRFWTGDLILVDDELVVHKRSRLFLVITFSALVVFVYSRIASLTFRKLLDIFAVPTIAAVAILRVGCFLAGCCWGDISTQVEGLEHQELALQVQTVPCLAGEWIVTAVTYPPSYFAFEQHLALGLIGPDATESLPIHPVQLYEAGALALLFLSMYGVSLHRYGPGMVASLAASSYAVLRFLLEYLRADGSIMAGSMTMPQLQCLALLGVVTLSVSVQAVTSRFLRGEGRINS